MKISTKILKFNCFLTSSFMLLYSVFKLLSKYFNVKVFSGDDKLFIYNILFYLLLNLIVFSVALLIYKIMQKRNSPNYSSNFSKNILSSNVDIFNFISVVVYWLANPGLLNHPILASTCIKFGQLNYFLIAALSCIANEFEEMESRIE